MVMALLSQAVSNVPAVMLFVPPLEAVAPASATTSLRLATAAFSTLAGNLTIIASVANIVVFETGECDGVKASFGEYLRVGAPVTIATLLIAWACLALQRGIQLHRTLPVGVRLAAPGDFRPHRDASGAPSIRRSFRAGCACCPAQIG